MKTIVFLPSEIPRMIETSCRKFAAEVKGMSAGNNIARHCASWTEPAHFVLRRSRHDVHMAALIQADFFGIAITVWLAITFYSTGFVNAVSTSHKG